jgi:hypothetical protein
MVREISGMRTVRRFDFTPVCVAHDTGIFFITCWKIRMILLQSNHAWLFLEIKTHSGMHFDHRAPHVYRLPNN